MEQWYDLTRVMARRTVVLDLWSFLTPPSPAISVTVKALMDRRPPYPDLQDKFTFLSLDKRDLTTHLDMTPAFFNDSNSCIPKECFDSRFQKTIKEKETMKKCREAPKIANDMQHGGVAYHAQVGQALVEHFQQAVLPTLNHSPSENTTEIGNFDEQQQKRPICMGEWGFGSVNQVPKWLDKPSPILHNVNFQISNILTGRNDKKSLSTNILNASLTLGCPEAYYKTMIIGYIAHSNRAETAVVRTNGRNLSTFYRQGAPNIRIRQYAPPLSPPVHIVPVSFHHGSYFEITNIACSAEDPPR
jgi:hypothetical protein